MQRCRMSSLAAVTGHGGTVPNFINGQFVESKTDRFIDCINPVRKPGAACRLPPAACRLLSPL